MVKNFNTLAEYGKKLFLEVNEGIKEEDIIISAHSDIINVHEALCEKGLAYYESYGTDELPLLYYNIDSSYKEKGKIESRDIDEVSLKDSIYQGIIAYHCDGFTFFKLKMINVQESPSETDMQLCIFTKDMFSTVCKQASQLTKKIQTNVPEQGIYRARLVKTMMGSYMMYEEIKDIQSNPAIHQCKEDLLNNADFFFNNVPLFSKFNQKPLRKFLLCGEPGTGKTSICYDVAKKYEKDMPVIFVTEFEDMVNHIKECANINRRTVVIFEDCEASLRTSGINSSILNFLDGIDRPNIVDGAIVIMTTNHPERIEARITKRPGRIDKIFYVKALEGEFALNVFNLYFGDFMKENNFDFTTKTAKEAIEIIASGMTGAQIKELFNSYVCYMVSNNREFNLTDVFDIKVELFNSFKDMDESYASLNVKSFDEMGMKLSKILSK